MLAHLVILALVESCQVKLIHRQGLPQAQVADRGRLIARDGVVIGLCNDLQGCRTSVSCVALKGHHEVANSWAAFRLARDSSRSRSDNQGKGCEQAHRIISSSQELQDLESAAHRLAGGPLEVVDAAVEADVEGDVGAGDLPGVPVAQPDVGQLLLVALLINCLQIDRVRLLSQDVEKGMA